MNTKLFTLPDLGEGLSEAEVREWYVQEGDLLTLDQPMISVETAKAVVDIPAPFAGKLTKRFGQPGDAIKTGHPIAEFDTFNESDNATVVGSIPASNTLLTRTAVVSANKSKAYPPPSRALPAVRALARQLHVNLDTITPSREDGIITADEVRQAAASVTASIASTTAHPKALGLPTPLNSSRRHMATVLSQAYQSVVPVTLTDEAIMPYQATKQAITLQIIQALITACQQVPALNTHFCGKTLTYKRYDTINLGLALDTPHGLYLPVLKSVEKHTPEQWRAQIDQFKQMAAEKTFSPDKLSEATIVLSNFGSIGGRHATPMVIPPTVAIIGTGRLYESVVADNKHQPAVRLCLPLSLTVDHRAITGGEAARFINSLRQALSQENS